MIDERRQRDADLADDLGPQLQRVASLAPCRERKIRPLRHSEYRTPSLTILAWLGNSPLLVNTFSNR